MGKVLDLEQLARAVAGWPEVGDVQQVSVLCAGEGPDRLRRYLQEKDIDRLVVGACSPREHEQTLQNVCLEAGFNPYLMAWANLREQCAYVTADKALAQQKARALLAGAVARARHQRPIAVQTTPCRCDVAVLGAGVAGLTAALSLAQGERKVFLIEKSPWLGGLVPLLDEVEPGGECASCVTAPLLDAVLHHERIEVMTQATVKAVAGFAGQLEVTVAQAPRFVDTEGCFGCETCIGVCPGNAVFLQPWRKRKAMHISGPGAVPHVPVLDPDVCLRFGASGRDSEGRADRAGVPVDATDATDAKDGTAAMCTLCADHCPFGNINLEAKPQTMVLEVGAVVVAVGAKLCDASLLTERMDIMPAARPYCVGPVELERLLAQDGPTGGRLCVRPSAADTDTVTDADTGGDVLVGADFSAAGARGNGLDGVDSAGAGVGENAARTREMSAILYLHPSFLRGVFREGGAARTAVQESFRGAQPNASAEVFPAHTAAALADRIAHAQILRLGRHQRQTAATDVPRAGDEAADGVTVHVLADSTLPRPAFCAIQRNIIWHEVSVFALGDRAQQRLRVERVGDRLRIVSRSAAEPWRPVLDVSGDLLVMGPRWRGAADGERLAAALGLDLEQGFFAPDHALLRTFQSPLKGVLLAGGAGGPVTVAGAATQGAAAAGWCLANLLPGRDIVLNPYAAALDAERCSGCRTCNDLCAAKAIRFDPEAEKSVINTVLCQGCGVCVAACPAGAITMPYFSDHALMAEITAIVHADDR
jgi:heterodisulfide reductase subunit A